MEILCKYDELVDIKKIKVDPKNRNNHPTSQIDRLAEILKYQGIRAPLVISRQTGILRKGHGTLRAMIKNKATQAPVVYQSFKNIEQEYAFAVSDNAIANWAELDLAGIHTDLPEFDPKLLDIDMLGIENFEFEPNPIDPQCDEDEIPEKVEAKTKLGDMYKLGEHRLLCGDSTDIKQVERLMGGEKAVMWQSDPPYGINHVEIANEKGQAKGYSKIQNDDLQNDELKEFIFKSIQASLPFLKKGFAFYMWHAMKMQAYFSQAAAAAAGILFHRQIIWVKPQFVFGRGQYHWRHELCLMGWLQGDTPPFYGTKNQSTVWELGRENDKIHPTQKPVAIWEAPIKNHMKHGEIVYEPFCGSGSQLIAAEKNSVKCYAMELDPHYCDVIVARWEKYTGKKAELLKSIRK